MTASEIKARRREMEAEDSAMWHKAHGWVIGGIDAAAFATLLTIVARDEFGGVLVAAVAMLCAAVPILTADLFFAMFAVETFNRSWGRIGTVIAGVGVTLTIAAIGSVAWRVHWACAVTFWVMGAAAYLLTALRFHWEVERQMSHSMEEAMAPECESWIHDKASAGDHGQVGGSAAAANDDAGR
jgi:hypothetical protein